MATERGADPRRRNLKRIAGSAGCVGAAAVVAANSASATFTGATAVNQAATSAGSLYLTIPAAGYVNGVGGNRMTLKVDTLDVSGTFRQRAVDVTNAGTVDLATFSITTDADVANAITDTAANGIYYRIDQCSSPWTETGGSDPTYTCDAPATTSYVLSGGAPTHAGVRLTNGTNPTTWVTGTDLSNITLTAGAVNHLRFQFKLDATTATNAAQGLTANVTVTFSGTQRSGTNK